LQSLDQFGLGSNFNNPDHFEASKTLLELGLIQEEITFIHILDKNLNNILSAVEVLP
jgi:hypothetical protein